MGIETAILITSLVSAGVSVQQSRQQRKTAKKAEKKAAERDARQQSEIAAQEAEEEKIRVRDVQRSGRRRRAGGAVRQRQTVLTGSLGIRNSAPGTEGGKSLLGL